MRRPSENMPSRQGTSPPRAHGDSAVPEDFQSLAETIQGHQEYLRLKKIRHHREVSVYTHNERVALLGYRLARRLSLSTEETVRGALLHDLFFYDWKEGHPPEDLLPHGFTHPRRSLRNAQRLFGPLSPKEKDIIAKHMWPLTLTPPLYPESLLICLVDKWIALCESLPGFLEKLPLIGALIPSTGV